MTRRDKEQCSKSKVINCRANHSYFCNSNKTCIIVPFFFSLKCCSENLKITSFYRNVSPFTEIQFPTFFLKRYVRGSIIFFNHSNGKKKTIKRYPTFLMMILDANLRVTFYLKKIKECVKYSFVIFF